MATISANGKSYDLADLNKSNGKGLSEEVLAGTGEYLPRIIAILTDALVDFTRAPVGTSSDSETIGTGSKTFTLDSQRTFGVGQFVVVADAAAPSSNYMIGQITAISSLDLTINVTTTAGSGTLSSWHIVGTASPSPQELLLGLDSRSSNTDLVDADSGKAILMDSGSYTTQSISAISGLTANWFVILKNTGSATVTIDPNSSETIEGLSNYKLRAGESCIVHYDGTALRVLMHSKNKFIVSQFSGSITNGDYTIRQYLEEDVDPVSIGVIFSSGTATVQPKDDGGNWGSSISGSSTFAAQTDAGEAAAGSAIIATVSSASSANDMEIIIEYRAT